MKVGDIMKLKEDRSLLIIILLSMITFGIYGLVLIHQLADDTNEACAKDGKNTTGLLAFILLSIITAGIYGIIWWFMIIERWERYLIKNDYPVRVTGLGYILWSTIGVFIIVGPIIGQYKAIHQMNDVAKAHNRSLA